jgi:Rrf2 family protein
MSCITQKSVYALQALMAMVERHGAGVVSIEELAKQEKIPRPFLEKIFNKLACSGIVISERGFRGGYRLSDGPESIRVITIIEALERDLGFSEATELPVIKEIFNRVESLLRRELSLSLSDFHDRHARAIDNNKRAVLASSVIAKGDRS